MSLILSFIRPLLIKDFDGLLNDNYEGLNEEKYVHIMPYGDYF
jgi:hypothetical protein